MPERAGTYANWELERRFLLTAVPDGLAVEGQWRIEDRYLHGTRLRLRRMHRLDAPEDDRSKLAQKLQPDPADSSRVQLTNIYLTRREHAVLAALPADVLVKERTIAALDGVRWGIDVHRGPLSDVVLGTVDFEDEAAMRAFRAPAWLAASDVSRELRYTGAALAAAAGAGGDA
ncbi:MAG: hypothetical protein JWM98_2831 [Thermoleophilia bacterium]|nr:hypothetical protein [Thermoleophilia bacterium]